MTRRIMKVGWPLGLGLLLLVACAAPTVSPTPPPVAREPVVFIATFTPEASAAPVAALEGVASPAAATEAAPSAPTAAATVAPAVVTSYEIQPGDTLLGLSLKFGVPIAAIQLQNALGSSIILRAGESLFIPPPVGWEGASPFWVLHEVQEGEVLSAIAALYGEDTATLQAVNGLADADVLSIGQPLILPLTAPAEVVAAANRPTPTPAPLPTEVPPPTAGAALAAAELPATAAPSATEAAVSPPAAPPPALPGDVAALAAETFRLVNEQRAAYGLPPLAWNATLAYAAEAHVADCYARGWCSHTGSDGSTMKERIIRAGYNPVRWSECWAWYGTPAMAVAMWMDEVPPNDPHRRTILSTWLTEVGVGVAPGNGWGYYFIADFGAPK